MTRGGAITTIWYGTLIGADWVDPPSRGMAARAIAGLALFAKSRRYSMIVTSEGRSGPIGLVVILLLLAITRKRKLVLMEFLPGAKAGLGRLVRFVYRRTLKHVCLGIQVMTEAEVSQYSRDYDVPVERLQLIPFYFVDERVVAPDDGQKRNGVLATGRQSCDWDTLLDAALGQQWDLTIVCSRREAERIHSRAATAGVRVLADIPVAEHDALLDSSALYVLPLTESAVSSGQIRLMSAISHRIPAIASEVPGISGYERLASRLVPPGDPMVLREAIAEALADPEHIRAAMEKAAKFAATRTRAAYADEVSEFLDRLRP